jgi:hypothetical protein
LQTKDGGLVQLNRPARLTIETYGPSDDFMLRFLDGAGNEITHDHQHDLGEAFAMAEREFGIVRADWTDENSN